MHIKVAGWIAIAFFGIIIVSVLWYSLFLPKATPQTTPLLGVTLPGSGLVPVATSTTPDPTNQIPVTIQNGKTISSINFIHNGVTLADSSNEGNYLLTGSVTNGFSIGYRAPADFFTIALEKEPLGEMRIAAENYLLSALGVSKSQLCSLRYYIGTDVHTNSFYAGKNLGFSFCPGAVALPQ